MSSNVLIIAESQEFAGKTDIVGKLEGKLLAELVARLLTESHRDAIVDFAGITCFTASAAKMFFHTLESSVPDGVDRLCFRNADAPVEEALVEATT